MDKKEKNSIRLPLDERFDAEAEIILKILSRRDSFSELLENRLEELKSMSLEISEFIDQKKNAVVAKNKSATADN